VAERAIRVFVSSTFRDMRAERDELAKRVFPALRKLCEQRGVVWGEVDLRWGILDEERAEGKVLPICLEEIRRCRPYFIGLLGERYGWVPDTIPPMLLESEPWLREHRSRSVTELEILHGVINNPEMAAHAFFYFRDPAYLERLPAGTDPADYRSESPELAGKLAGLKERIRESSFPVRENYGDPVELGRLVLADLSALVDALYPEESAPAPLDRDAVLHEAFARSRRGVYIGRPAYIRALDEHAAGAGPPLVVLGESGGGKSALLANWAEGWRRQAPDRTVIEHYIGASVDSADWAAMLRRVLGELDRAFRLNLEIPDKPDALRLAFANGLHRAAAKGRVVLILDALNQLEDRDGAPDLVWLPPEIPANVRLIVSTLPGRPLEELTKRKWPVLKVEPLEPGERAELIASWLASISRKLSAAEAARIAAAQQCANPLYLRALLEELRLHGEKETLPERISYYLEAATPEALYERILQRYERDYDRERRNLVRDALTAMWASRRGLTEEELLAMLGTAGQPLPQALWAPLSLALDAGLISRSGLVTFAHDYLRQSVARRYVPEEEARRRAHLALAEFFEAREHGRRRTDELPWQLAAAGQWKRLATLLAEPAFFRAAWKANESEVKEYWARIEAESTLRMLDAYRSVVEQPGSDTDFAWRVSVLLADAGHLEEALSIRSALTDHFRRLGDNAKLAASLGNQAIILQARGDLDGAMALHKEEEGLCRQLRDLAGLARCLGNQAIILQDRGDLDGALALHKEEEGLRRQLRDPAGLGRCLGNIATILIARGYMGGALELLKGQERLCRQLGDLAWLAASLGNEAIILQARGDLDVAMALHKEEERLCRQLGDPAGLKTSLGNQALILKTRGDLEGAMALNREAERLCRQLGDPAGLGRSLGNEAGILYARGDLGGALTRYKEQERLCRQLGDPAGLQRSLGGQALILHARGDLDGAMVLHREEERLCRQLEDPAGLARSLGHQAVILKDGGDLDGAMALYKEAERLCRQWGDPAGLQRSLGGQALILRARGDLDGAIALHKEEERLCRQSGDAAGLASSLGNQANTLYANGDLDGAMALHKEEECLCRQLGDTAGLAASLGNQAPILRARGDLDGALALWKEQERFCRELGDPAGLQASLNNQALVLKDGGNLDGAMALYKEAEHLCRELGDPAGLASSLANQSLVLCDMSRPEEALPLAEEAQRLASSHGLLALEKQLASIFHHVQEAARRS
jgi:Domain of unknown function (DUF4062)/MalT-like TPR region/NACHT domain